MRFEALRERKRDFNAGSNRETPAPIRGFTYTSLIHRAYGKLRSFVSTSGFSPMRSHLHPEEKLAILRAADPHRKWFSLDDQRVCVLCDKAITGRQIDITPDSHGGYSLHCPTEDCLSVPSDWFYRGSAAAASKASSYRRVEADLWAT
jgi:hypothetical protein